MTNSFHTRAIVPIFLAVLLGAMLCEPVFSQNGHYRRPSESDIQWLLGNGTPKRPQRQSNCDDLVPANYCEETTRCGNEILQAGLSKVAPCKPACTTTSRERCGEIRNPACQCTQCNEGGRQIAPCTRIRSVPMPPPAPVNQEGVNGIDNAAVMRTVETVDPEGQNDALKDRDIMPVVGIPSDEVTQTSGKSLPIPASPDEFPASSSLDEIVRNQAQALETTATPTAPTPIDVKVALKESVVLPKRAEPVAPPAVQPPTRSESHDSKVLRQLPAQRHSTHSSCSSHSALPQSCGPVTAKPSCDSGCRSECCAGTNCTKDGRPKGARCLSSFGRSGDCSCEACCGSVDEIVASTLIGDCLRKMSCLYRSRAKHGSNCNCWLCADLDNPDMIGDAGFLPNRFAGFLNPVEQEGIYQELPTMLASRLNIAEHFNAEVRDRIWFDYRHMNNAVSIGRLRDATSAYDSKALDQFTFGLEKQLVSCTSLELRVPVVGQFESGLNPNEFGKTGAELGNIGLVLKYLFTRSENLTVAGGIGLMFPTAEDWKYETTGISLKNKAYSLVPYLGAQWHPNDSTFGHALIQFDIPVSENELHGGDDSVKVDEPTIVRVGVQVGRWFYRNERGMHSCRLGGFFEIDYSAALDDVKSEQLIHRNVGSVFFVPNNDKPQALNMIAGVPILFGQLSLTNAVILPLTSNDRQFSVAYSFSASRRF